MSVVSRAGGCALLVGSLSAGACGKGATAKAPAASSSSAAPLEGGVAKLADAAAGDPRAADLWKHANDADADDLARLARYVGTEGLVEACASPARRLTALAAFAYVDDFVALPFLARVATGGKDAGTTEDEATAALGSIVALAAEPRRAIDPEDALEIGEGCATLLLLAKDAARPAARRARAVSALRLLADRGWVQADLIPTDIDAR